MLLRPFLNDATSCASYVFGCGTHAKLAVVDPHADLVDDYLAAAAALGAPIVAVFETHVQADHLSGLPALVALTGATAYLPAGAAVDFDHIALPDGDVVELGNTLVTAMATSADPTCTSPATRAARHDCCTPACSACSSSRTALFSTRATTRARSAGAAFRATRSPRSVSSVPTTRCSQ